MDSYATFIALLVMGLILFISLIACLLIFYLQYRAKKETKNKRLATILTPSGYREDKLLPVNHNELRDTDPDTKESIPYYIRPDKSYQTYWPFGRPKILQVAITSFLYAERNPEPIDPFGRVRVVDGVLLGNLKNINFSRAMVGRSEEIVQEQQRGRQKKKIPVMLFVILGVALLGGLVAVMVLTGGC